MRKADWKGVIATVRSEQMSARGLEDAFRLHHYLFRVIDKLVELSPDVRVKTEFSIKHNYHVQILRDNITLCFEKCRGNNRDPVLSRHG